MNDKFYVSYEAARLLKEKGYNNFTKSVYRESNPSNTLFFKEEARDWNNMEVSPYTAAPTKAEAIDWLDSKGIIVELNYQYHKHMDNSQWEYFVYTYDKDRWFEAVICSWEENNYFNNRLEAEDAAIIKALELL